MPLFFENSRLPSILSKLSPIDIWAITLGPLVFCRGELYVTTRRHETIHWQQYIDLGIIFFPVVYLALWLVALARYRDGNTAYRMNLLEQEAYDHEDDDEYLANRKRYAWWEYVT